MPILTLDMRNLNTDDKHKAVLEAFDSLELGERMILINDHDPSTMFEKLEEERGAKVEWEHTLEGPEQWESAVSKRYYNFI